MDELIIGKLQVWITDNDSRHTNIRSISREVTQSQYDAVLRKAVAKDYPLVIYTDENEQTVIPVRILRENIIVLTLLPVSENQSTEQ